MQKFKTIDEIHALIAKDRPDTEPERRHLLRRGIAGQPDVLGGRAPPESPRARLRRILAGLAARLEQPDREVARRLSAERPPLA